MMPTKWKLAEIPDTYLDALQAVYGYQSIDDNKGYSVYRIKYARTLTEHEKYLFASESFVSPQFFTQVLYKLRGSLSPIRFNRMLREALNRMDILRLNYCSVGNDTLAVVFQERKELPEVIYRNIVTLDADDLDRTLQQIMEADMRQGFNLKRGNLIRFTVLHTNSDEYAILVTGAELIMERIDVIRLFRGVTDTESLQTLSAEIDSFDAEMHHSRMEDAIRDYWLKVLNKLPGSPLIPCRKKVLSGKSRPKVYRKPIPADIMSDLRRQAKSNRMMLMVILQTAWAVMLQEYNDQTDVFFCLLVADPRKQGKDLSGAFHVMPVRCRAEEEISVQKLVQQQFQQIVISRPYSSLGWEDLKEITGHREKLFDHFLSFYDFMVEEQRYSEIKASSEGTFVLRNAWDARGSRLGLYFRYSNQGVTLSVMYDGAVFGESGGQLLVQRYLQVLQQMLTDWDLPFAKFCSRLSERLEKGTDGVKSFAPYSGEARIQDVLSRIPLLQIDDLGIVGAFRTCSRLVIRFQGDRIFGAELEENLVFIANGKVVRNIDTGDGWYNTLDIRKDGDWVNESVFLSDRTIRLSAEVLTEEAMLLLIPLERVYEILGKKPGLWRNIVEHNLRQMEKYQRLWVKS